jgi:hypothetical protein
MRDSALAQLLRDELAGDELSYVLFRWLGPSSSRYRNPRWEWLLDRSQAGGGAIAPYMDS